MTIVYTKPDCQQCTAVKRWLERNAIAFTEADATVPEITETLKGLGYMQAPVTTYLAANEEGKRELFHFSGFNPAALDTMKARLTT